MAPGPEALTVVHVSPGSPAAIDGWKAGERIVAIGGKPIDQRYIERMWNWRFGASGTVVVLTLATGERRILRLADFY